MDWQQFLITILTSVLASSGLWTYITKQLEKKDVKNDMLVGLAHDRILYLGMSYLERDPPYITQDEYENLKVYLYEPYEKMGGNGSAKRIMQEIDKIPIRSNAPKEDNEQ